MNSNEARMLNKLYRLYQHIVNDPVLLACHPKAHAELQKVEKRIYSETENAINSIYTIPGITQPTTDNYDSNLNT